MSLGSYDSKVRDGVARARGPARGLAGHERSVGPEGPPPAGVGERRRRRGGRGRPDHPDRRSDRVGERRTRRGHRDGRCRRRRRDRCDDRDHVVGAPGADAGGARRSGCSSNRSGGFLAASEAKHAQAAAEMGLLLHYTAWAVALGEVDHWAGVVSEATNAGALAAMSEADLRLIGRSPSLGRDTGRTIVVPAPSGGGGWLRRRRLRGWGRRRRRAAEAAAAPGDGTLSRNVSDTLRDRPSGSRRRGPRTPSRSPRRRDRGRASRRGSGG